MLNREQVEDFVWQYAAQDQDALLESLIILFSEEEVEYALDFYLDIWKQFHKSLWRERYLLLKERMK